MNQPRHYLAEAAWIVLLTSAIFFLDLMAPDAWAVWPLYFLPLALSVQSLRPRDPWYLATLVTVLAIGEPLIVHGGRATWGALFNRSVAMAVMWMVAGIMAGRGHRRPASGGLRVASPVPNHAESQAIGTLQPMPEAMDDSGADEVRRRQVSAAALAKQRRLEGVIESAMDAIITTDEDQTIILFNRAAEDMFACKAADVLGRPVDRLIPERFRPVHREHVKRFGQSGVTTRRMGALGTITGLRLNGEEFPIEAAISQIAVDGRRYYTVILRDITARQRAEAALQETTERLQLLMRYAPAALAMFDRHLRYLAVSQRWITDYRLSEEDLIHRSDTAYAPELPEHWQAVYHRGLAGEVVRMDEDRVTRADGSEQWLRWEVRPWHAADGSVGGIVVFTEDVTDRRRAMTALEESETRFRQMAEAVHEVIWIIELESRRIIYLSPAIELIWGRRAEEFHQDVTRWLDTVEPDDRQRVGAAFSQWIASNGLSSFDVEYRIRRPDGDIRWIHDRGSLIRDRTGKAYRATGIAADISRQKRAESALQRERDFIEAVLETAGALVVVLGRDGAILRFNRACEHTTGYSSEEVTGKRAWDFLLVPEEIEAVKGVFEQLKGGAPRHEHEHYWVSKTGHRRRIAWANTVITDRHGEVDYVVATGIDVTQLIAMQEQLRRTERIAELGTLASGMAHEIGTPMNVILGRAEYLMNRTTDAPTKKGLQTIISQVERITRVINQLLSFARRRPPERRAVALRDAIESSLDMFHERLAQHHVTVELDLDESCPVVQADPDHISQVMINLLVNAIHAMPDGGHIRIAARRLDPTMVEIAIADNGAGIPADVLPKIFDPFFTTKEFGAGTGLGLTVVKGIMEEHGGTIRVSSEPGRGTTFFLTLPSGGMSPVRGEPARGEGL